MKKTYQYTTGGTSAEIAYTAQKDGEIVSSIIVSNESGGAVNVKVYIDPDGRDSGAGNLIVPQKSISNNSYEELIPDSEIYLDRSGTVSVLDATGSAVAFTISIKK